MIAHTEIEKHKLRRLIKDGVIVFSGNKKLKIYGTSSCCTGKRMKKQNRLFFKTETEALQNGFRPCGKCLKAKYLYWKTAQETG